MPLFKRHREGAEPGEQPSPAARVLSQHDILDRLEEEIFRAERYGRSLVVLCVLPQRLPGEAPEPRETTLAADAVSAQLRFSDRVGTLEDGTLAVLLPETTAEVARVIAHRIVADLAIRPAVNHHRWLVGTSTFPDDGADPPALMVAALQRAQS